MVQGRQEDAGSVDERRGQPPSLVRPLGGLERVFHFWMRNNPLHFSIAAEIDGVVTADRLRSALAEVQDANPLLAVRVLDEGTGPAFYRADARPGVRTVEAPATWTDLVGEEMTLPFDPRVAPLFRATLVSAERSVVVLTFEHSIADGLSAVVVLEDLVGALNGRPPESRPVPRPLEALISGPPDPQDPGGDPDTGGDPDAGLAADERMHAVGHRRPFDGSRPHVSGLALPVDLTARLAARCRTEGTTVHGAVCAAATGVFGRAKGRDFVRVFSPVDVRALLGADRDVALYITVARTGFPASLAEDLWGLARATGAALAPARSPGGVRAFAAGLESALPAGSDAAAVESFLLAGLSREVDLTNLGVVEFPDRGPLRVTAVWGPVILNQLAEEQVLGVATFGGSLRVTYASHDELPGFPDRIGRALEAAVDGPHPGDGG